jgi:hypothetical protein
MDDSKATTETGHRHEARAPLDQQVHVEFEAGAIVGPGQNISSMGVFFTADARLPVTVRIGDSDQVVRGEVVRFESMSEGRIGIAVRFLEPQG